MFTNRFSVEENTLFANLGEKKKDKGNVHKSSLFLALSLCILYIYPHIAALRGLGNEPPNDYWPL